MNCPGWAGRAMRTIICLLFSVVVSDALFSVRLRRSRLFVSKKAAADKFVENARDEALVR